ncbi:ATP-dependent DNA helicase RecG [Candidatus Manganitrophus noduliformans]|uniref:ATP-dependent DNA helicase RecG n=1 Tax=Candidatus Manganitrophus noduliformans TaxID=2606439 RepID=A0A7X6DSH9_9BACT|nr:ATP-dependent DNA helicase RecG [Candidatus Manganitrophus noduliformans]NKE72524.1 ATP-dependent DNA helicase RecG [Candidatus Manganitrophus noduliformans]
MTEQARQINDSSPFPWDQPIQYLKGVGPKRAVLFGKLGIETLEDLLLFSPFRYEDRTALKKIAHLQPGEEQTILAEIKAVSLVQTPRRRMKIVDAAVMDETGLLHAKWFNQPYLKDLFKVGEKIMLSGKVKANYYGGYHLEMESPLYEKVDEEEVQIHMGRIVPIYHETKGVTSRQIRSLMKVVLNQYLAKIPDILPSALIQKYNLIPLSQAILGLHFPASDSALAPLNAGRSPFHRRLSFDELFLLQTGLALRKKRFSTQEKGISFRTSGSLPDRLRQILPFQLTPAQEKVLAEIKEDMASDRPMNRLVQGDVGSGKTLVALMSILIALENGYQTALMAPTEILAEQHYLSIRGYIERLGRTITFLTSEMRKKAKEEILEGIRAGAYDLVIGTHALIQEGVEFKKLGMVVVDEQHKFGVLQRAKLAGKGYRPDVLIMTATPIPRTLALTLYGDLNISIIDALPPGRSPIRNFLFYGKQRERAYSFLEKELAKGRQAYVVCPLIEESEKSDLKAALELSVTLQREIFPHRRIGLLHGRLKREEKESIMREFKEGRIDLLVATTVVEVGIDVPNATLMLIEHAERFGLAQLHQLRGRVGRGREQSFCLLAAEYPISAEAKRRLDAMVKSNDGFKIAEIDLEIRGPGEFFGTRQSGIPELRIANLMRDTAILETARREAFTWVDRDPNLTEAESRPIRLLLERKWKGKLEWLTTG